MTTRTSPIHTVIPHLVEAVRGGAVQRGAIRDALVGRGVVLGQSTLSGLLRLAVAQGFLARSGAKKGTRYAVPKWKTATKRAKPTAPAFVVEVFEDAPEATTTAPGLPDFEDL
jgi:hypothetical protein